MSPSRRRPGASDVGATSAGDPYVPDHGNGGYQVERYDLDLDYRLATNALVGRATISAVTTQELARFSLDLVGLDVTRVVVDRRRPARFRASGGKLRIVLAEALPADTSFTIEVAYRGSPRPLDGICGEVGWEELTDGVIVAGQPEGAPTWFPCNDHPADKAAYRIAVTAESAYTVIANGSLADHRVRASRTTWVYEQVEPMATYLATVQVGRYHVIDLAGSPVPQRAAVPSRLRRDFHRDFDRQADMIALFSRLFGPYPFREYTVVVTDDDLEIPLEAQGLSVFGANHLDGDRGEERMVAHELAHQWFGNSLTVAAWRHVWLNEGFACYAEWLWSEEAGERTVDEWARHWWGVLADLDQDLLLADPGPDLLFDDRVYKRGALTLHTLRLRVGDAAFFDLLRAWVARHRHVTVTTEAFVDLAVELLGPEVHPLFDLWLHQLDLPDLPEPD